jgi:hypothetical protein
LLASAQQVTRAMQFVRDISEPPEVVIGVGISGVDCQGGFECAFCSRRVTQGKQRGAQIEVRGHVAGRGFDRLAVTCAGFCMPSILLASPAERDEPFRAPRRREAVQEATQHAGRPNIVTRCPFSSPESPETLGYCDVFGMERPGTGIAVKYTSGIAAS